VSMPRRSSSLVHGNAGAGRPGLVFSVIVGVTVVGVVGLAVLESEMWLSGHGSNSKKSSSTSWAKLAVDFINGAEVLGVKAVVVDRSGGQSVVFAVSSVFGIVISIIVVGIGSRKSSIRKLSSTSSLTFAVDCVGVCDS